MSAPPVVASLKIRVTSGCFHREHSPHAYDLIDEELAALSREPSVTFVEHENGPELVVVLSAALSLTASVINLVVAILGARGEGIRQGDRPSEPIELIVRRSDGSVEEETVLRIGPRDPVDREQVARRLDAAVERLGEDGGE